MCTQGDDGAVCRCLTLHIMHMNIAFSTSFVTARKRSKHVVSRVRVSYCRRRYHVSLSELGHETCCLASYGFHYYTFVVWSCIMCTMPTLVVVHCSAKLPHEVGCACTVLKTKCLLHMYLIHVYTRYQPNTTLSKTSKHHQTYRSLQMTTLTHKSRELVR